MTFYDLLIAINRATTKTYPEDLYGWVADYPFPYYHLFYLLAKQCEVAVELGVEKGRASAALAVGNPACQVYGMDHNPQAAADKVAERFTNFYYIKESSTPIPSAVPPKIDFLHIDTEHSYTQAENEFTAYKDRLNPGSVVCFDDTHAMDDGVLRYLMTLSPHYPIILDDRLHPTCGYGVLYYVG